MRIQLEFDERGVKMIDRLKEQIGVSSHKELFNNALTLLDWAVQQRKSGRMIASLSNEAGDYRELQMPALEYSAAWAKEDEAPRTKRA